jgi:hypothetical protein
MDISIRLKGTLHGRVWYDFYFQNEFNVILENSCKDNDLIQKRTLQSLSIE